MSFIFYFVQSWLIGLSIAIPIGPIGILCIRKTLERGFTGTLGVALGVAIADALYAIIATTGLTIVSNFLFAQQGYIKIIGGLLLIALGIRDYFFATKTHTSVESKDTTLVVSIAESCMLTLANPMTILIFMGIFTSIAHQDATVLDNIAITLGIFCGSMTWFLTLGKITLYFKGYLAEKWVSKLNIVSTIMLIGFGVWACISGYRMIRR